MTINVLFVCLGNICRSPMAEAIFQQLVDEAGLTDKFHIDSAGTGDWHVGEQAHPGTRRILAQHGIAYNGRSRLITAQDMANSHSYIITMDQSNGNNLRRQFGQHPNQHRLLEFSSQTSETDVPDPYYTNNFEYVYQLVKDGCTGLLETIRKQQGL
ncbi:low molecular weight protein-tyrosine-phosphatase [Candidatus Leptofilum sp.]|uniref:low molecular weight protein-tyrosine-phosphatase n=1 Tax=Candidatus Leptofilum sp. TaxID=3241576 RepID=UPI003B5A5C99